MCIITITITWGVVIEPRFELAEADFLRRPPNRHILQANTDNKPQHSTSAEEQREVSAVRRWTGRLGVTAATAAAAAAAAAADAVLPCLLLLLCYCCVASVL